MIRAQIYFPEQLYSELKRHAKIRGIAISELVRRGIRQALPKKKAKKFGEGFIGAGTTSTKTNAVQDIKDYYKNDVV